MVVGTLAGPVVDERALSCAPVADPAVVDVWRAVGGLVAGPVPEMGLSAGERPVADVEVLASLAASAEYELARRLVAAEAAGGLALTGRGAALRARGWSPGSARRLVAAGRVAAVFPAVAAHWAAGVITAEHAAAVDVHRGLLTDAELEVALRGFEGHWGVLGPREVGRVIAAVACRLHPPPGPERDEVAAYEGRHLAFAVTGSEVLVTGSLPRVEGEAFMAVIEALAEAGRTAADQVPAASRRADALMALVERAVGAGSVPTRGGLPVALNVTLTPTGGGDILAVTSRGHDLTCGERRFACCDPTVTPVLLAPAPQPRAAPGAPAVPPDEARVLAIAGAMLEPRQPMAVGRTTRIATPAQRRALAVRDKGCVIPGCATPAELCQVHHLLAWADGGATDLDNEVLLCWSHHRQVDLDMWRIEPADPSAPLPRPDRHAPPGTPWPAGNGAPWKITRQPRTRWRM